MPNGETFVGKLSDEIVLYKPQKSVIFITESLKCLGYSSETPNFSSLHGISFSLTSGESRELHDLKMLLGEPLLPWQLVVGNRHAERSIQDLN